MECSCVRQTELPHATKLFTDLTYHFDRVRAFYPHSPHDPESDAAAAREVNLSPERRAALVSVLRQQNGPGAALDLLAKPRTVAVVTGQQVGLFSGPAYTIYKALTAARLASELTARGIAAVPVFWVATEDHDFAEVNHAWVFDRQHRPVKLEVNGAATPNQQVGEVRLNSITFDALRESLHELPFGAEMADRVAMAYMPGLTLGEAFGALLRDLLGAFDILQIDPMAPGVRELAAPTIRTALAQAPELKRLVLERNRELNAAGYHAQVHVEDQTSFFFLLENGRRIALRKHNGNYTSRDARFSPEELMDRTDRISPNALLRPVVQDSILPTVAYIGGPAGLAYLAPSERMYRVLLGRMAGAGHPAGLPGLHARTPKVMAPYH